MIHLSDAKGNGYGKGKHGALFNEDNKDKLKSILDLYHKYNYHCPVTLEVNETDYSICDNYKKTRETVFQILEK